MIAWALSGGGNRGPIQVGAMRALFERGIRPEMMLGTSAGALNATYIASDPTPVANEQLAQLWLGTASQDIFPKPQWLMILRALFGANGFDDDQARRRTFAKYLPSGVKTFGDLKTKLYLTASDLQTGRLFLYGDDPNAQLLEAALASTGMPVMWEPQLIMGHQFVDGGVVANVPVSIALDRGATEIYALDLQYAGPYPLKKGVIDLTFHVIGVMLYQQVLADIARCLDRQGITLHYINLGDIFSGIDLKDLSHTAEMMDQGYQRTKNYLDNPTPNRMPRVTGGVLGIEQDVTPPGAVPYEPKF